MEEAIAALLIDSFRTIVIPLKGSFGSTNKSCKIWPRSMLDQPNMSVSIQYEISGTFGFVSNSIIGMILLGDHIYTIPYFASYEQDYRRCMKYYYSDPEFPNNLLEHINNVVILFQKTQLMSGDNYAFEGITKTKEIFR